MLRTFIPIFPPAYSFWFFFPCIDGSLAAAVAAGRVALLVGARQVGRLREGGRLVPLHQEAAAALAPV